MDCDGNDGFVEEFYLVFLDGRLEYLVRICCCEDFCFLCIYVVVKEFKCMFYLLIEYFNMMFLVDME